MYNYQIGLDGRVLKCFKCNSMKHLTRYYNYWPPKEVQNENIYIMLLSTEILILVKEVLDMGRLDSTCTRTVMGTLWLNAFLDVLTESDKTQITYSSSNTKFHIGDGVEVKSVKVKVPAFIGSKKQYSS